MYVRINGVETEVPEGITVAALLKDLEVVQTGVAVAVNQAVIPRTDHTAAALEAQDHVEIIQAVGGG